MFVYFRKKSATARASAAQRVALVTRMGAVVVQDVAVVRVRIVEMMRKVASQQEEARRPQLKQVQVSVER